MHDSRACLTVTVCLFNIMSIGTCTYPTPEQGSGRMVPFSSESVHDLGVGERHLAMSLYKLKASVTGTLTELST